jgi:uncharacterized protein (TIGR02246 family)
MLELAEGDCNALMAINAGQEAAWNRGDAEGYAERALPGIVFTNVVGARYVGRAAVVELWRSIFKGLYKDVPIRQRLEHSSFLQPDVAIMETINSLPGDLHALARSFPLVNGAYLSRMQQVLVRRANGWWVASGHNVLVLPMAATTLPPDVP